MSDDGWVPEEFTSAVCRPVTLGTGETVPVLGDRPMDARDTAALGQLVAVVRAKVAAEHPPEPGAQALYARIDAARTATGLSAYQTAKAAGVALSVLTRLANGRMPGEQARAAIETWLAGQETSTPGVGSDAETTVEDHRD
jgi:hypothetical protein